MGVMINGVYREDDPEPDSAADGAYRRAASTIRHWITPDGSVGPTGEGGFAFSPGRYHLFLAWNCPWAHRALLVRHIKGLHKAVGVSFAAPRRTADGWIFEPAGAYADQIFGSSALHEIYARAKPPFTGRVTVPLLWDLDRDRAVSNESADIVEMLNSVGDRGPDLFPADLREEIAVWNALIYSHVNNGVYRAGFARTQEAYDNAVGQVFDTLDRLEVQLSKTRYLTGERLTACDLRLFPTLARFDVAYHYAFKCNIRRLRDYPNLWAYARDIYQLPGVSETVKFDIYKRGYFSPSPMRNPLGIVPAGPVVDWSAPHGRG